MRKGRDDEEPFTPLSKSTAARKETTSRRVKHVQTARGKSPGKQKGHKCRKYITGGKSTGKQKGHKQRKHGHRVGHQHNKRNCSAFQSSSWNCESCHTDYYSICMFLTLFDSSGVPAASPNPVPFPVTAALGIVNLHY